MKIGVVLFKILALAIIWNWIYLVITKIQHEVEGKLTFAQTPCAIWALYLDYCVLAGFGIWVTYEFFVNKKNSSKEKQ